MDGIAGLGKMKFYVCDVELVVVGHSCFNHVIAVELVEQSFCRLERILRRNDEPYLVEVRGLRHDVGDDEVPDVDRVERSEEQADP